MRFGTWNVRSLHRAGSFTAAARQLARYKLDLVGVQEVRWGREGTVRVGNYNFFYGWGNENHQLGIGFFVQYRKVSAVQTAQSVSDRVSYIVLKGVISLFYICMQLVRRKVMSQKTVLTRN